MKGIPLLKYETVECSNEHIGTLFDLLSQRTHSVSHNAMPSLSDHKSFVKKHPYRAWYLIKNEKCYIGTVYITYENHIAISLPSYSYDKFSEILDWIVHAHKPLNGLKSVRPSHYQINVPIGDIDLDKVLSELGHTKIQVTYLLKDD